jgi:hypothetical protein
MNAKTTVVAIAAAIAAAIIALTGCGTTATTPPATTAAVSTAPAAPTQADQIAAWTASPGYDAMQTVQADLNQLSTDADAGDAQAVETDGAQLSADAQLAENSPPPVGAATYAAAMQAYVSAGDAAASGDFTAATVNMSEGTALVNRTTTAISNAEN